jgi:hypothetical protein
MHQAVGMLAPVRIIEGVEPERDTVGSLSMNQCAEIRENMHTDRRGTSTRKAVLLNLLHHVLKGFVLAVTYFRKRGPELRLKPHASTPLACYDVAVD